VTTQLLFLLDTIVQANEDALAVLVETDQPDDLQWTRTGERARLPCSRARSSALRAGAERRRPDRRAAR
jgi:hypothetical protein